MRKCYFCFLLVLSMMTITSSSASSAEEPEFNGEYIRLTNGEYISLDGTVKRIRNDDIKLDGVDFAIRTRNQLSMYGNKLVSAQNFEGKKPKILAVQQKKFDSIVCRGRGFFWNTNRKWPLAEALQLNGWAVYRVNNVGVIGQEIATPSYIQGNGDIQYWLYPQSNIDYHQKSFGSSEMYKPKNKLEKGVYSTWNGNIFELL